MPGSDDHVKLLASSLPTADRPERACNIGLPDGAHRLHECYEHNATRHCFLPRTDAKRDRFDERLAGACWHSTADMRQVEHKVDLLTSAWRGILASVFITYRGVDVVKAEQLADDLITRGHNVWFAPRKISAGDSIVEKIDDGLTGAVNLLLCLSNDGPSAWTDREWMAKLAAKLNGTGGHVIPVRLTGGTLPAILADINYVDLTMDWASGIDKICSALR